MFERFTNQSRRVVVLAQEEARMLDHNYIGTEHLLLGLLNEGRGSAARALHATDVTLQAVRDQIIEIIGRGQAQPSGHIPFTPRAKKSLELSLREALQLGDGYIGTGHLLLGLIHQGDNVAVKILGRLGADLKDLRARVTEELRGNPEEGQDVSPAEREQQQLKVYLRGEAKGLLDTIDDRLTAIERRLGIRRPVPVAMRNLEVRIAQVRRDKEAAIDVQDFGQAAALRDAEKQLIMERARVEQETAAGAESADEASAVSEAGAGAGAEGAGAEGEVGAVAEVGTSAVAGVGAVAEVGTSAVAGVGADVVAGVGADVGAEPDGGAGTADEEAGEPGELGRLRARVADLESRLREHGIDPDEPGEASAATG